MDVLIRPIQPTDDAPMARVIRETLAEFDADGDGFAGRDAEMQSLSQAYTRPRHAYFVAQRDDAVLGGVGVAPLAGGDADTAELRKMYLTAGARGAGLGRRLLFRAIETARALGFRRIYLETLTDMRAARHLYEQAGFRHLARPMGNTGHHGCNSWLLLELDPPRKPD